jgi:hypothetical protein
MSTRLNVDPGLDRPDDFYEALIAAHRGLDDDQSMQLNCRLVLLLANHVGDLAVLHEALRLAGRGLAPGGSATEAGPAAS